MTAEKQLAISKAIAEHSTRLLDSLDKIKELYLYLETTQKRFEDFKDYMEKLYKEEYGNSREV